MKSQMTSIFAVIVAFTIIDVIVACGNKNQTRVKRDGPDFGGIIASAGAAVADLIKNAGIENEFNAKFGKMTHSNPNQ